MAKPPRVVADTPPSEMAQVPPRDLHSTSDIRFVITEVSKLTTQVERLIVDVKDLSGKVDAGQVARLVDDVKDVKGKVSEIEKNVSFVKGAMWVIAALFAFLVAAGGLYLNFKKSAVPVQPVPVAPPLVSNQPQGAAPAVLPDGTVRPR